MIGLISTEMKSWLLAEKDLTYKRAVELALGLEAAEKHVEKVSGRNSFWGSIGGFGSEGAGGGGASGSGAGTAGEGLHALRGARSGPAAAGPGECWRCGKRHRADKSRYKQYTCDKCNGKGHLKNMCKVSEQKFKNNRHHYIEDESDNEL